jgi:hypothetical protein
MRGLIEHHLGMRIDGRICRFEQGGMTEEEFAVYTKHGLPKGWVAWHAGTVNAEALRKVPVATLDDGRPVPRHMILAGLREAAQLATARRPRISHDDAYGEFCEMNDSERFGAE